MKYDFNIRQGDTFHEGFHFSEDLTDCNFKMTLIHTVGKRKILELLTNENFDISYNTETGNTEVYPIITAEQTAAFHFSTAYYDLQVSLGTDVATYFTGEITLIPDITLGV